MLSAQEFETAGFDRRQTRGLFDRLRAGKDLHVTTYGKLSVELLTGLHPDFVHSVEGPLSDGTTRFTAGVGRDRFVETVVIPHAHRSTVCLSVQVGCRRACVFCATGRMGLVAHVSAAEIVGQVAAAARIARQYELPPIRNLVFMGMGEPLDNAKAVGRALAVLTDPRGWAFAPRHVTVSTVGPSVAAVRLARPWPGRIAWSLHAADEDVRRALIPTAGASVDELAEAFCGLVEARRQPLFVEIALIDRFNDDVALADVAAALFRGRERRVRFNLLPVNPTASGHRPSPDDRAEAFRDRLRSRGFFAMIRRPRGREGRAACGQLVTLPSAGCQSHVR